jgi:hypothetical protein
LLACAVQQQLRMQAAAALRMYSTT